MSDTQPALEVIVTMYHSDEESGTSVMSDGSKVFWTGSRGHDSQVVILGADGIVRTFERDADHPAMSAQWAFPGASRKMTLVEEHEWALARADLLVWEGARG